VVLSVQPKIETPTFSRRLPTRSVRSFSSQQ
jgi:hypothetical protein